MHGIIQEVEKVLLITSISIGVILCFVIGFIIRLIIKRKKKK